MIRPGARPGARPTASRRMPDDRRRGKEEVHPLESRRRGFPSIGPGRAASQEAKTRKTGGPGAPIKKTGPPQGAGWVSGAGCYR